jgi:hypothetical protein
MGFHCHIREQRASCSVKRSGRFNILSFSPAPFDVKPAEGQPYFPAATALQPQRTPLNGGHLDSMARYKPYDVNQVTLIHQILPGSFENALNEIILSARDDHHRGNTAAQIEQRVQFDCGLACAKLCTREKRQTQIDGGGVQGIQGVVEFEGSPL